MQELIGQNVKRSRATFSPFNNTISIQFKTSPLMYENVSLLFVFLCCLNNFNGFHNFEISFYISRKTLKHFETEEVENLLILC